MKAVIREIVLHLLFVLLSLFVAFGALDPFAFNLTDSTRKILAEGGLMNAYSNISGDEIAMHADKVCSCSVFFCT